MGIAVDTARSKLYWTASSGKVKQANLNGSGAKNVVSGLGSPSDMVLSNSITAPAAVRGPQRDPGRLPPTRSMMSMETASVDGKDNSLSAITVAVADRYIPLPNTMSTDDKRG